MMIRNILILIGIVVINSIVTDSSNSNKYHYIKYNGPICDDPFILGSMLKEYAKIKSTDTYLFKIFSKHLCFEEFIYLIEY